MGAVVRGEVVRFDQVKGYGFITPRGGGEDVFLHVNDLLDDKHLIQPGVTVEFVVESGDRGLKASSVHVVPASPARVDAVARTADPGSPATADADDDLLVDVIPEREFTGELTEILLTLDPALTGGQVLAVRGAVAKLGRKYGWIGD